MWQRRLITAGLLTVALAATVWTELKYQPAINTSHPQPNQTSDQIHNAGQSAVFSMDFIDHFVVWTELHHDFVIAIGTVFLALFTLALSAATWGLLRSAKIQVGDMQNLLVAANANANAGASQAEAMAGLRAAGEAQEKSLREQSAATVILANAASKSANIAERALFELEAPHLVARVVKPGVTVSEKYRSADQVMSDSIPKEGKPPERFLSVEFGYLLFNFGNYGRGAAQLISYFDNLYLTDESNPLPPPIDPGATATNWLPAGLYVMSGMDSQERGHFMGEVTMRYNPSKNGLFFMGFVRYSDLFDNRYISGFCFQFDSVGNQFFLAGGDAYNYRRREEKADQQPRDPPPT